MLVSKLILQAIITLRLGSQLSLKFMIQINPRRADANSQNLNACLQQCNATLAMWWWNVPIYVVLDLGLLLCMYTLCST